MVSLVTLFRIAAMRNSALLTGCALLLTAATPPAKGPRFERWIDGTLAVEPETQVQAVDGDTFVIRQSVKTNFEAPFLYLLFGKDRALLLDTGSGGLKIRPPIEHLIAGWRAAHGGREVKLTVAHSHSHGDHHAGDDEFAGRADTDVIGLKPADVAAYFHVATWPVTLGKIDLGGRVLDVIPTPGHEPSHIMVYDAHTGLLLSGDMLYPGRLYVPLDKFGAYQASAARLVRFAKTHPIRALLGAHIEMTTTAGQDFGHEAPAHPAEHGLALPVSAIYELHKAVKMAASPPVVDRHAEFIVNPVPARPDE